MDINSGQSYNTQMDKAGKVLNVSLSQSAGFLQPDSEQSQAPLFA